ncbi:ribbon-helix-helix domain-containing protein [Tardiphaga sp.]|jgi:predicted DNA-binding ribbon-helix-helix protein|uniref:ribbon-helix-helix domain-containing protein n=1 Tax=Tardiphaga sp. TaxID=1926292 RepID=UPI0037DA2C2F
MSAVRKRSVTLGATKTSISLEDEFWDAFKSIARVRGLTTSQLVESIAADKQTSNLSSVVRIFILKCALSSEILSRPSSEDSQWL